MRSQAGLRRVRHLRGEQGDPADCRRQNGRIGTSPVPHAVHERPAEANGSGWRTDYPWAQRNLLIRLSELTKTRVSWRKAAYASRVARPADGSGALRMRIPDGVRCRHDRPVAGGGGRLGIYLQKGGFLWVDDFWGEAAWEQWTRELAKAMPSTEYAIEDVPLSDPIFHSMLEVKRVPQVTGIGFWRAIGGRMTSERGEETAVAHLRAIRDTHGRIMS